MHFFDEKYARDFLAQCGLDPDLMLRGKLNEIGKFEKTILLRPEPEDYFQFAGFVAQLASKIDRYDVSEKSNRLLVFTEFGIWPSSENWYLFKILREANGCHEPIWEKPCQFFSNYEYAELVTFIEFGLRSGWGGLIFGAADNAAIYFSHDEWIRIGLREARDEDLKYFENLKIVVEFE